MEVSGGEVAVYCCWRFDCSASCGHVVNEELEQQQHAQDQAAPAAQHCVLLRLATGQHLLAQCTQVPETEGRNAETVSGTQQLGGTD